LSKVALLGQTKEEKTRWDGMRWGKKKKKKPSTEIYEGKNGVSAQLGSFKGTTLDKYVGGEK